jgi:hypothetical protein
MTAPAPYLTARDCCSACDKLAVNAGNDELKVCPRCYAVLWHCDYMEQDRRFRAAQRAALARERQEEITRNAIISDRIRMLIERNADAED